MASQQQGVVVRLFIFSGRPDPEWPLDEAAVADLVQNAVQSPGLPNAFTVFRGVLTEPPGPRGNHWQDAGGIESWLLSEARARGHGKAIDALGGAEGPIPR